MIALICVLLAQATDVDALVRQGVAADAAGRYQDARTYFEQALAKGPDMPRVLTNAAVNQAHLGRTEDAIKLLKRTLELDANNAPALFNYARLTLQTGNAQAAATAYDRLALQSSSDPEVRAGQSSAHTLLANRLFRAGKVQESLAEYQKALDADSASPQPYAGMVLALVAGESRDGAGEVLAAARKRFPRDVRFFLLQGYEAEHWNNRAAAIESYREATRMEHNSGIPRVMLGRALRADAKLMESETCLREAVARQPRLALAHYELAQTLLAGNSGLKQREARQQLEAAWNLDKRRPESPQQLAKLYLASGNLKSAQQWANLAATADPLRAEPHYLLLQIYGRAGNTQGAEREAKLYRGLKAQGENTTPQLLPEVQEALSSPR